MTRAPSAGAGEPASLPSIENFERGLIDPATFTHREHLRMGYELLRRHDFPEALLRYCRGLKILVARAKAEDKFNLTITVAFLALIAERMESGESPGGEARGGEATGGEASEGAATDFDSFADANPALFDPAILKHFYTPARLNTAIAKRTFLLPDGARLGTPG